MNGRALWLKIIEAIRLSFPNGMISRVLYCWDFHRAKLILPRYTIGMTGRKKIEPDFFRQIVTDCSTEDLLQLYVTFDGWLSGTNIKPHHKLQIENWLESISEILNWLPSWYCPPGRSAPPQHIWSYLARYSTACEYGEKLPSPELLDRPYKDD